MDIKSLTVIATAVIESFVQLTESQGIELNNVTFQLKSKDDSDISSEVNFLTLVDETLIELKKFRELKEEEGCVVVPLENVRFFSNDGENYQTHETLEEAKHEAECAIEYYSDRLADQQLDPRSDGNFQQISYGIVLAGSSYSVDHIVTQQDIDDGEYSYDVGTEIMSLFLVEAARGGNE